MAARWVDKYRRLLATSSYSVTYSNVCVFSLSDILEILHGSLKEYIYHDIDSWCLNMQKW
jgi:hypothetical protein